MIWHILIGQNNRDTTPSLNIEYWSQNFVEMAVVVPCISFWTKKCPLVAFRCRLCRPRIHLTTIRVDFINFRAEIYNIKHPAREEGVVFVVFDACGRAACAADLLRNGVLESSRRAVTSSQRSPKYTSTIQDDGVVVMLKVWVDKCYGPDCTLIHERRQRAQHRSPMNSSSRKLQI